MERIVISKSMILLLWLGVWSIQVCHVRSFPSTVRQAPASGQPTIHAYLCLSPLIGGPVFLPVHSEVILRQQPAPSKRQSGEEDKDDDDDDDDACCCWHRFDFVPQNPTDPETLQQLVSLQAVPGTVRYRTTTFSDEVVVANHENSNEKESIFLQEVSNNKAGFYPHYRGGWGLVLPLPACADTAAAIGSAQDFCQDYQVCRGDLHLVTNNCWTFCWDLLQKLY
jgi:hypothetical protein